MLFSFNVDNSVVISVYCIRWSEIIRYNIGYKYSIHNRGSDTLQKFHSAITIVVINHSVGALKV